MLAHLNVHSNFSKMRGTASLQELLARAKAYGQKYLALTEVNGLWGFIRFVQFAKEADIKPIAGTNILTASMISFCWRRTSTATKTYAASFQPFTMMIGVLWLIC